MTIKSVFKNICWMYKYMFYKTARPIRSTALLEYTLHAILTKIITVYKQWPVKNLCTLTALLPVEYATEKLVIEHALSGTEASCYGYFDSAVVWVHDWMLKNSATDKRELKTRILGKANYVWFVQITGGWFPALFWSNGWNIRVNVSPSLWSYYCDVWNNK